jgi:hypothetical protein
VVSHQWAAAAAVHDAVAFPTAPSDCEASKLLQSRICMFTAAMSWHGQADRPYACAAQCTVCDWRQLLLCLQRGSNLRWWFFHVPARAVNCQFCLCLTLRRS